MDTKTILELSMIKCAVRFDPKNINAWCDTKTHGQLSKDLAEQLLLNGYCLQKISTLGGEITSDKETELTTNDGE